MKPLGNSQDSRRFDRHAISVGIPSEVLMENAAFSLFHEILKMVEESRPDSIVVLAGGGGNGGDGFALLRIIADRLPGISLHLYSLFDPSRLSGATLTNYRIMPDRVDIFDQLEKIQGNVIFVDAMVGTGLSNDLSEKFQDAVSFVNSYPSKRVLAVDVPSGISSDTGEAMPIALKADVTVTMGILKQGLYLGDGISHAGRVVLGKISAPRGAEDSIRKYLLEDKDFYVPEVAMDVYKNRNGHALFVGGDPEKLGAIFIAAEAFMASGGGLATVLLKKEMVAKVAGRFPGIMLTADIKSDDRYDVVVVGPGLSSLRKDVRNYIENFSGRVVLDAGMFDLLAKEKEFFEMLKGKEVVFTPHPGELSRVQGDSDSWLKAVESFELEENHILYAKNASSVIRSFREELFVPPGARALAFGGTGDALCGIFAAMIIRREDFLGGVVSGALLHRKAGLILEKERGVLSHRIEALLDCIAPALRSLMYVD